MLCPNELLKILSGHLHNQSHPEGLRQNIRVALRPGGKQEETVTLHLPWPLHYSVTVHNAHCTAANIILWVPNWTQSRYFIRSVRTKWSFLWESLQTICAELLSNDDDQLICINMTGTSCCYAHSSSTLVDQCGL